MEECHQSQSYQEVRNENAGSENDSIKNDLPPFSPCKGEIGNEKDDRGKGAGVDPVDEARDQHGGEAPFSEPLNDGLLSFLKGFFRDLFPWRRGAFALILGDQFLKTFAVQFLRPEIV